MRKKQILIAVADAGAANYLVPLIGPLRERYEVIIRTDVKGQAGAVLQHQGVDTIPWAGKDIDLSDVDLVICGTAGKAHNLWRAATIAAHQAGKPCLWLGDFFGSGSEERLRDLAPDHMAVLDSSTRATFLRYRPSFPATNVHVVGNPAFDSLSRIDRYATRMIGRQKIGVHDADRVVAYSASSLSQFNIDETLDLILPWLKEREYIFTMRFHATEGETTKDAVLKRIRDKLGHYYIDPGATTGIEFMAAADLHMTDYSTAGVESMISGIPTAFVMLESAQAYQSLRGGAFPFFPILDIGKYGITPAIPVFSSGQVERLNRAFNQEDVAFMHRSLNVHFRSLDDGRAGERVLKLIDDLC